MGQCCSQQVNTAPNGLKPVAIPGSEANNDEKVNGSVAENRSNGFKSGSSFNELSVVASTCTQSFDSSPGWTCRKPSPSKHIQAKRSYNDTAREENFEDEQPKCLDKNFGYARNFSVKYELGPEVGRGHFGYTCYAMVKSGEFQGQTVAVKIISKSEMPSEREIEDVRREVKILKALSGHPNLVQFHDAYEDHDRVYIVMELCSGGELLDHILTRGGRYEEDEAKAIVAQMLNAVSFIHLQGVVHRDLKPENFLFSKQDDISLMKAIDFGLSDFLNPDVMLTDIVGSAYYVAPEVLEQSYGTEADVWSIGVIVYILLSGNRPFWAQTESGIFCAVRQAIPDYDEMPWPTVSDQAKDFVKRLLTKDPRIRLTAAQALSHPWLRGNQKVPLDMLTLKLVKSYLESSSLRRSALKALAKTLTEEDFYFLGAQFMLLRPEKDGGITLENFKMALLKSATEAMQESHAWRILKSMTALSLHKMYFHEFCAAAMNVHQLTMLEDWHYNLRRAYEHFDRKGNRVVSVQELAEEMQIPETIPASTFLHDWIRLEDGKLSFKGFTKLLLA